MRRGRLWWLFWLAPVASSWLAVCFLFPSCPAPINSFSLDVAAHNCLPPFAADATGHILRHLEAPDSRFETRDDATPERRDGLSNEDGRLGRLWPRQSRELTVDAINEMAL